MSTAVRRILLTILIISVAGLGFVRDGIFIHTNELIEQQEQLSSDSAPRLTELKWLMTAVFSGAYLFLAVVIIKLLFQNRNFLRLTVFFYLLFIMAAAFLYVGGYLLGDPGVGYSLARKIMGMVQSPILIMILVPGFYLGTRATS